MCEVIPVPCVDTSSVWLSLLLCQLCIVQVEGPQLLGSLVLLPSVQSGQKSTHCPAKVLADGDLDRSGNSRGLLKEQDPKEGVLSDAPGLQLHCVTPIRVQFVAEATC